MTIHVKFSDNTKTVYVNMADIYFKLGGVIELLHESKESIFLSPYTIKEIRTEHDEVTS